MISLQSSDAKFFDFWMQKSENVFLIIDKNGKIIENNGLFEEFGACENLIDIVTQTHKQKILQLFEITLNEQSYQKEMIPISLDYSDVTDIPKTYNIFTNPIDSIHLLIILEPLAALNHNEAKAYFRMVNDYAMISRKLQNSEYLLHKKNEEYKQNIKEIEYLSNHDALTTLYNRRKIFMLLLHKINQAKREKHTLSIVMLDIDDFKNINDSYGHQIGDQVLQSVSKVLKEELRNYDSIGRYGGEEFLAILENQNLDEAVSMAERLRFAIKTQQIDIGNNQKISVQMSLGVAQLEESDNDTTLIQRADLALYKAKEKGKDRVVKLDFKES